MQISLNLKTTKFQIFLRPSSLEVGYSTCIAIAMFLGERYNQCLKYFKSSVLLCYSDALETEDLWIPSLSSSLGWLLRQSDLQ